MARLNGFGPAYSTGNVVTKIQLGEYTTEISKVAKGGSAQSLNLL